MAFKSRGRRGGDNTTTHNMSGANGTGRPYKMDGKASRAEFSRGASKTHSLNAPGGVSAISGAPMRGGIRL
jgi:hypothetical protein